jgi:hypothetical protein
MSDTAAPAATTALAASIFGAVLSLPPGSNTQTTPSQNAMRNRKNMIHPPDNFPSAELSRL